MLSTLTVLQQVKDSEHSYNDDNRKTYADTVAMELTGSVIYLLNQLYGVLTRAKRFRVITPREVYSERGLIPS